jgi:hypothetical protein
MRGGFPGRFRCQRCGSVGPCYDYRWTKAGFEVRCKRLRACLTKALDKCGSGLCRACIARMFVPYHRRLARLRFGKERV